MKTKYQTEVLLLPSGELVRIPSYNLDKKIGWSNELNTFTCNDRYKLDIIYGNNRLLNEKNIERICSLIEDGDIETFKILYEEIIEILISSNMNEKYFNNIFRTLYVKIKVDNELNIDKNNPINDYIFEFIDILEKRYPRYREKIIL